MLLDRNQLDELADWGATLHGFLERCRYLYQHPDAKPGQAVEWTDADACLVSILTGCVLDILVDAGSGSARGRARLDIDLTEDGVILRLTARRRPRVSLSGFRVLRQVARRFGSSATAKSLHLVFEITGTSLRKGLPASALS
jgi:hypothetical protein